MTLLIKNGNVIDPVSGIFGPKSLRIENGLVSNIGREVPECGADIVIDASGLTVTPGLIDMHTHLRDPGFEYKEDIISGANAAVSGGFTTIACMPNTKPAADSAEIIKYILDKAKDAAADVVPIAAVTKGQKGIELTDMEALVKAGAAAFSDDGFPVFDAKIMRGALSLAKELGVCVISHCEDERLVEGGVMNEGAESRRLGLQGRPAVAEELMVARDAMLARNVGAHVHIAHVSTKGSVDIIRKAKESGVNITCETCPQYFTLTESEIAIKGAMAKVNPPLRTEMDVEAIICGLADGTIDVIATDHAPHAAHEKNQSLELAPSGMIGLETALSLAITALYKAGRLDMPEIIAKMTVNPARILGLNRGGLKPGSAADIVIFDTSAVWIPDKFISKSSNTPFKGMALSGAVMYTVKDGSIVYKNGGY